MALTGKTAVVTGGSRGIGRAIVRRLARDGARVVFSYRQDQAAADALAREVGDAVAVRADQEDPRSIEVLFGPVADRPGQRDHQHLEPQYRAARPGHAALLLREQGTHWSSSPRSPRTQFGPRGITVNTVSPGATDTGSCGRQPPGGAGAVDDTHRSGRLGEPADIADVVAFLAGPDARWLTGQNIQATGGLIV